MQTSMSRMNRSPIALVVDDDWAELNRLERAFTNQTAIGVICVDHLQTAADIVETGDYEIAAVVADLRIDPPKRDRKRDLVNGTDFLGWLERQPNKPVAAYIHSVDGANPTAIGRTRAAWRSENIRFFQKTDIEESDPNAPWSCIEREYLVTALRQNAEIQRRVAESGCNVEEAAKRIVEDTELAERIRHTLDAHRITYINSLPEIGDFSGIRVKRPIEILCRRVNREKLCKARCISIGILSHGEGETMFDALNDLRLQLVEEFREFSGQDPEKFTGYALHVWSQMKEYLEIIAP